MSLSPFNDPRAVKLLSRVREDLSHLRQDIASLVSHTTHRTLPDGARGIAENARHHLAAGGAYAASRLKTLRNAPRRETLGIAGGLVAVGVIALGVYALCKSNCRHEIDDDEV